jgi:hypothetical protein
LVVPIPWLQGGAARGFAGGAASIVPVTVETVTIQVSEPARFIMNTDATITETLNYLVEFSDDGEHPEQSDPEVIIIGPKAFHLR